MHKTADRRVCRGKAENLEDAVCRRACGHRAEKRIAEASYRDIVTGYGNFEKFKVDAQAILNDNPDTDYVMFYFNIKNFKYNNET